MPRIGLAGVVVLALALALGLGALGCQKGPGSELVGHLEAMVELMETHKESPDLAAQAVETYVEENRADLERLRAELQEKRAALPPSEVGDLANELLRESGPLMERAHRLMSEHPGLAANERLRKALQSLAKP